MDSPRIARRRLGKALRTFVIASLALAPGPAASAAAMPPDLRPVAPANFASALPEGWQHGAFMEIFVRGYQDGNGDGIGDLKGLTQRLDYLQALGIKGLWLMPITASQDHDHGYAVTDYRRIEPAYGTLADLDELLRQAHRRGIGVVMDYVVNHSAKTNPLFAASARSRRNRFRHWYVWEDAKPEGWRIWDKDPWTATPNGAYFGQFGGHMPDFNLRNPATVAYHRDSLRFWLNRGLDGFRIDAVGHLFENGPQGWNLQAENYPFMAELRRSIGPYARRYWVCESPGDPIGFAADGACGASFAFGHSDAIVKAAQGDAEAVRQVADYFVTAPDGMATMVSNHDRFAGPRLWDAMQGDVAKVRLAAATYLLEPGTPFIYYGEELGMAGTPVQTGQPRDWELRGPVSWTGEPATAGFTRAARPFRALSANAATNNAAREAGDPESMLAFYKGMLALRNTLPAIARGRYESPQVTDRTVTVRRTLGAQQVLVAINYGDASTAVTVAGLPPSATLAAAWPAGAAQRAVDALGQLSLTAPPQSVQVFVVQP